MFGSAPKRVGVWSWVRENDSQVARAVARSPGVVGRGYTEYCLPVGTWPYRQKTARLRDHVRRLADPHRAPVGNIFIIKSYKKITDINAKKQQA